MNTLTKTITIGLAVCLLSHVTNAGETEVAAMPGMAGMDKMMDAVQDGMGGMMDSVGDMMDSVGDMIDTSANTTADVITIVSSIPAEGFKTLVEAVTEAGLIDALSDPETALTVFAPTDDAFEAAMEALNLTAPELLALPTLGDILQFHVVEGRMSGTELIDKIVAEATSPEEGITLKTLSGNDLKVTMSDDENMEVFVNGVKVSTADVDAGKSVIHALEGVLIPVGETEVDEEADEAAEGDEEEADEPAEGEEEADEPMEGEEEEDVQVSTGP